MSIYTLLLWLAVPVFVVCMAAELAVLWSRRRSTYDMRDAAANVVTALGNQLINTPWVLAEIALLLWINNHVPWHITGAKAWVVAVLAVDFTYYWYHRSHHEIRVLWASHVTHHSSESFNLSVALRQTWFVFTMLPFLVPVALLGVDAKIVMAGYSINLLYQFFVHTELVDKLWAPIEFVFNTPSHHRVHHGTNNEYLDRNYGGILILWDRLFGTFEPERAPVVYGLTKNVKTYNVVRIETHEYAAIWRDVKAAASWRVKLGHLFRGPGWQPAAAVPAMNNKAARQSGWTRPSASLLAAAATACTLISLYWIIAPAQAASGIGLHADTATRPSSTGTLRPDDLPSSNTLFRQN